LLIVVHGSVVGIIAGIELERQMKHKTLSLRLPLTEANLLTRTSKKTGKSINQLIVDAVKTTYGSSTNNDTVDDTKAQLTQMQQDIEVLSSRLAVVEGYYASTKLATSYSIDTGSNTVE
jgi:uncharacterized protein (DUF1778 family)